MKTRLLTLLLASLALYADAAGQQRLLVVGGGERPPEAMRKFVEWCGGEKARVLVITWASGEPDASFAALRANFQSAGAGDGVLHAPTRPLDQKGRSDFVEGLAAASCVFFSGGDQNRIMDVLADAGLLNAIRDRYQQGMPVGGTSAGAAAMSDPMMTGEADLKSLDGEKVGVRRGIGLVRGVIFDQHFLVRQRHNRLFGLMMKNPRALGIGIDEDTSVIIEDNRRLTVIGKTYAMFVHAKDGRQPFSLSFLKSGEQFDLKKRRQTGR